MSNSRKIEYSEVQKHNKKNDCWVIINDQIYDLTNQKKFHPVGESYINIFAGKDATWFFNLNPIHYKNEIRDILKGLKVGNLIRKEGENIPDNKIMIISLFILIFIALLYYFLFV
ncbi:hypothetical protein ABPG72_018181 [Tetrahymena utriculariae]